MGWPYNILIPPALLFLNPGVTREQFANLLDQTHASPFTQYSYDDPWDSHNPEFQDLRSKGLKGLAGLLQLPFSDQYKEFNQTKKDEQGIPLEAPLLLDLRDQGLEVVVHTENQLGDPERKQELSWQKLGEGDIWIEVMMAAESGKVLKIFAEESQEDDEFPAYKYDMLVKPIARIFKRYKYATAEEALKEWPPFHVDKMYDWSKQGGPFHGYPTLGSDKFLWKQEGDKYYLDETTFDIIPSGITTAMQLGYTDLIMTAEAIRHNAWKLLSYKGLWHLPKFLEDFPEAKAAYDKAVWDSHTSLYAKRQRMTVTELLRMRASHFLR